MSKQKKKVEARECHPALAEENFHTVTQSNQGPAAGCEWDR
jgi:hypothetical protein